MSTIKNPVSDLTSRVINNLPWSEVRDLLRNSDDFRNKIEEFDDTLYRFVAADTNQSVILKSILKHLKATDPGNATLEKATNITNAMMNFAKLRVSELEALRNKKK